MDSSSTGGVLQLHWFPLGKAHLCTAAHRDRDGIAKPGCSTAGISPNNQCTNGPLCFSEINTECLSLFYHYCGVFSWPSEIYTPSCLKCVPLIGSQRNSVSDQKVAQFCSVKWKHFSNLWMLITAVAQGVTRTAGVNESIRDFTFHTEL